MNEHTNVYLSVLFALLSEDRPEVEKCFPCSHINLSVVWPVSSWIYQTNHMKWAIHMWYVCDIYTAMPCLLCIMLNSNRLDFDRFGCVCIVSVDVWTSQSFHKKYIFIIFFFSFHSSNFHCGMADRQIDSLLHFTHAIYMWDVNIEYERMADLRRMPRCRESRMCVISLCFFFFIYSLHCAANIENERRRPAATAAAITTYSNERDNFFILSQFEFSLSLWLYG